MRTSKWTTVEHLAHGGEQGRGREWLGQKSDAWLDHALRHDDVGRETRDVEDARLRANVPQCQRELSAAHLRHHHIGHHERKLSGEALHHVERSEPILRDQHAVAALLEHAPGK